MENLGVAIHNVMNGLKNSKIPQDTQSQTRTSNPLCFGQTKNKAFEKCKATCPGPDKCPQGGALFYSPVRSVNELPYGPYSFECEIYRVWRKQIELERKVMDSVPKKFWDKSFLNFNAHSADLSFALEISKKYAHKRAWKSGANLVLLGKYGVGKTHLAASIIRQATSDGDNAILSTASSFANGDIKKIRERFKEIRGVDLVAIDDFSVETSHKMIAQEIFELINYRYESEMGMVITTNLSPNELKNSLGDRIFDRVQERTVMVEISDAESYRKRRRKGYVEWME